MFIGSFDSAKTKFWASFEQPFGFPNLVFFGADAVTQLYHKAPQT